MSSTYAYQNSDLDYNFGKVAYTPPTNYYLAVSTTTPNQSGGTNFTEPTDVAYARVLFPNNKTYFSTSSSGIVTNALQMQFPEATASWGTVTYAGLFDALTGGNLLVFSQLTLSRNVEIGTTLILAIGALQINLQNV